MAESFLGKGVKRRRIGALYHEGQQSNMVEMWQSRSGRPGSQAQQTRGITRK